MKPRPFDNVKNQIGFCGIWCGSCPAGNGAIVELTGKYEEIVKENQLEKWAPKDFDFKEFMKGLASIQKISLCPGCRSGGGNPVCKIRTCAKEKNKTVCHECTQLSACDNFQDLEKSHPHVRKDLIKAKHTSQQKLIENYAKELKRKFPHCILSCDAV